MPCFFTMEAQRSSSEAKCIYEQLCQSLLDVHHAADTVFNTVVNRVSTEHGRLNNLTGRISSAKAKIATISSTNQATTLFSSAKYPYVDAEESDFKPLFPKPLKVNLSVNDGGLQDEGEGTIELFRFFSETNHEYMLDAFKIKDGIGIAPAGVKSVADMLLFNSTELPYSKYKIVDNLEDARQPSIESRNKNTITLPPPPHSILHSGMVSTSGVEEYGFRPVIRQVPSFKLPSSLPHLSMVAKDSQAGNNNFPLIAPSAVHSHSSAYSHKLMSTHADKSDVTSSKDSEEAFTDDDIKDKDFKPPPPPPPLPSPSHWPSFNVKGEAEAASTSNAQAKRVLAAKEPFSTVGSIVLGDTSTNISDAGSSLSLLDSQHNALLASIRNPGIALRKTGSISSKSLNTLPSPIEQSKNVKGPEQQTASTRKQHFDILAEMATTLKMRRLSMQGATSDKDKIHKGDASKLIFEDEENASGTTYEKKSNKLPPPMVNLQAYITQARDVSSNDEEWDD